MESDTQIEENPNIELTPRVIDSGITTVVQLRELIKSPAMYTNAAVFDLFCSALESGILKMARQRSITPLHKLITIAHEAHVRLEIWLALSKQGFRQKTTNAWHDKRREYWNDFCKLVAQDRKENEEIASTNRLGGANYQEENAMDENNDNDYINPEYF